MKEIQTVATPRDERGWQHLNYHGPLSLPYLAALLEPDFPGTNTGNLAFRQHRLVNYGNLRPDRPGKRLFGRAIGTYYVYANSPEIDEHLITNELAPHPSISLSKWNFHHETFLAHCSAAMELGARKHGWTYKQLPNWEIPTEVNHTFNVYDDQKENWKREKRSAHTKLKPDKIFQLEDENSFVTLLLEADRGNEQVRTDNLEKKAWLPTILKYIDAVENQRLKAFGITGSIHVLLFFNKRSKMEAVKAEVLKLTGGKGKNYFDFFCWPEFLDPFYVPSQLNYGMWDNGFERVGYDGKKQAYQPFFLC